MASAKATIVQTPVFTRRPIIFLHGIYPELIVPVSGHVAVFAAEYGARVHVWDKARAHVGLHTEEGPLLTRVFLTNPYATVRRTRRRQDFWALVRRFGYTKDDLVYLVLSTLGFLARLWELESRPLVEWVNLKDEPLPAPEGPCRVPDNVGPIQPGPWGRLLDPEAFLDYLAGLLLFLPLVRIKLWEGEL